MTPLYRSNSAEQHSGVVRGARWRLNPAYVCELRGDTWRSITYIPPWDMPDLLDWVAFDSARPPDWYALWWVGEHVRRGHEPHPRSEA